MGDPAAISFGESALQEIVGNQLSAITFVMDYVQLAFDGPLITAYTWPTIQVGDRNLRRGELSYRDELCGRIAIHVAAVRVRNEAIDIAFADGSAIRISFSADDLSEGSPEAAEFNGSQLITFRPDD
jgi:hypothetical protein